VVEVRGGPYVYNLSGRVAHRLEGTAAAPVFVVGRDRPLFTCPPVSSERELVFDGSYYVVQGIRVDARGWMGVVLGGRHGVLRDSEVFGMGNNFNPAITGYGSNLVVLRNHVHDNGPVPTLQEFDVHGVKASEGVTDLWVLDNLFERNSGDDVQIGDDCIGGLAECRSSTARWPARVYIGRNRGHTGGENCIDVKQAKDVIISENECWNFTPGGTSDGAAGITHNAAQRVWWVFNRIRDSEIGIRVNANTTDDGPPGSSVYLVGNVFSGIRSSRFVAADGYTPGAAVLGWNNQTLHVIDNTVTASDRCIAMNSISGDVRLLGNLCDSAKAPVVHNADPAHAVIDFALFSPTASVRWGDTTYDQAPFAGQCGSCRVGAARLDASFRPQALAAGGNVRHAAYGLFQSTYGRSIDVDQSGRPRPATGRTIGALEAGGPM
jgi:hypothetical protein